MRWRLSKRAVRPPAGADAEPAPASREVGNGGLRSSGDGPPHGDPEPDGNGRGAARRKPSSLPEELSAVDDVLGELRSRLAAIDGTGEIKRGLGEPASGLGERSSLTSSALGGYSRPVPDAWLFREEVLVSAGPFVDLLDVQVLAQALTALPPKPEAEVWGFDGNKAVIRLSAEEPLRLADDDIRSLPFRPRVVLATPSALTLELELPPVQRRRAEEGPGLPLHLSA